MPDQPRAGRLATDTGTLTHGGVLHAVETERAHGVEWARSMCAKVWHPVRGDGVHLYDYRYRTGRLCRSAACQRAFREELNDAV